MGERIGGKGDTGQRLIVNSLLHTQLNSTQPPSSACSTQVQMTTKATLGSRVGLHIHLNSKQEVFQQLKVAASPHSRQDMLLLSPIHLLNPFLQCKPFPRAL